MDIVIFSLYLGHQKMQNFTSGWVRNCVMWRPGTSQVVTSKQERKLTHLSNQTNRNVLVLLVPRLISVKLGYLEILLLGSLVLELKAAFIV